MSFINRRKQEVSVRVKEVDESQKTNVELTPRQKLEARIGRIRQDATYDYIYSVTTGIITTGLILNGESNSVTKSLEEIGVNKPVALVVGIGVTCLTGAGSVFYGASGVSRSAEAISLDSQLQVQDMLEAEQAQRLVAMPQPELQWRGDHE